MAIGDRAQRALLTARKRIEPGAALREHRDERLVGPGLGGPRHDQRQLRLGSSDGSGDGQGDRVGKPDWSEPQRDDDRLGCDLHLLDQA